MVAYVWSPMSIIAYIEQLAFFYTLDLVSNLRVINSHYKKISLT